MHIYTYIYIFSGVHLLVVPIFARKPNRVPSEIDLLVSLSSNITIQSFPLCIYIYGWCFGNYFSIYWEVHHPN